MPHKYLFRGLFIVHVIIVHLKFVKLFVMSTFVSLFQTKTQMNDLMDGLIQDMSTGIYTTKRPYPVQRCVLAQSYNSNVS